MNQKKSEEKRKNNLEKAVKVRKNKTEVMTNVVIGCIIAAFVGLGGYAVADKIIENKKAASEQDAGAQQQVDTVKTIAESKDMSVKDFLAEYGLPDSISDDTAMSEVYALMTVENLAKFNGSTVEQFRSDNSIPESITNDTTWGDTIPQLPFKAVVGEEQVEQFKQIYGLDDSINADTPWGEVQPVLEQKQQELTDAMDNANKADSGENSEDNAENTENNENKDAE